MASKRESKTSSFTLFSWVVLAILVIVSLTVYLRHISLAQLFATEAIQLQNAQSSNMSQIQEEAGVIAHTIATTPEGYPLVNNPGALENYVLSLSEKTNRDISVMDTKKRIYADVIRSEIGTTFAHDKGDEVTKTLNDGLSRTFVENSTSYPNGIAQTVVAIKNNNGTIIGALVLSSSTISGQ